ncbi:MAG: hypothetical protein V2I24_10450 [Halieaceae bacterium]|jgi:hypothetical protein|nr:hypothetical protein [Halieaceae bacterium]
MAETLLFIGFCGAIAYTAIWAMREDALQQQPDKIQRNTRVPR